MVQHKVSFAGEVGEKARACGRCNRAAIWRCSCGEYLCAGHRRAHAVVLGVPVCVDEARPAELADAARRLLSRVAEPQRCVGCGRDVESDQAMWARFPADGEPESIFCEACVRVEKPLPRPRPGDDNIPLVRLGQGCSRRDLTPEDVTPGLVFDYSDVLVWRGLAAAAAGVAMMIAAWVN